MRNPSSQTKMPELPYAELLNRVADGLMVRTHSAQVQPGDAFVALPGSNTDGSAYIPDAVERGAAYVLVREGVEPQAGLEAQATALVRHPDPRAAVGELAAAYFKTADLPFPLLGITGTNGKTTTSFLVEYLFAACGKKVGVLGTVSYRWPGVTMDAPLTTPDCWQLHEMLSRMAEAGVELAVMEVSSHALHQNRTAGLEFTAAALTNVTQDHLDYHQDMEAYFQAKSLLFQELPRQDKINVLNWDDPYGRRLLQQLPDAVGYGLSAPPPGLAERGLHGRVLSCSVRGLELEITRGRKSWRLTSPLIGRFNAANLLAAQALGLAMGLSVEQLAGLENFMGVPGRLERIPNKRGLNVFVDYAHTPDALENVLAAVKELDFRRLITVFGCGGNRDRAKRPLMGQAVCKYSDVAVLTSDNPRHEQPLAIMNDVRPGLRNCAMVLETPDRRVAIATALQEMHTADVLVVCGKGHEAYQQVGDERRPYSDQAVIRELLA